MIVQTSKRRDKFSKAKRSQIMSRIRSKNTSLDLAMKSILRTAGIAFEMYPRNIGHSDFLIDSHIAVFCDSSFWHGRNWRNLRSRLMEGSNPSYWVKHILANRRRDREVTERLTRNGYIVMRFWDEQVFGNPSWCLNQIREKIDMESSD